MSSKTGSPHSAVNGGKDEAVKNRLLARGSERGSRSGIDIAACPL
jgi:hypothetical protein